MEEREKKEDTEEAGTVVPSTGAAAAACTAKRVNYVLWVWTVDCRAHTYSCSTPRKKPRVPPSWCCCAQSVAPDTTRGWSSVPVIGAAVLGAVVVRDSATDRRQAQQCTMPLAAAAAVSIFSTKRDTDGMAGNEQRAKRPSC